MAHTKAKAKSRRIKKGISIRNRKVIRMAKGNPDGDGIEQYVHSDKISAVNNAGGKGATFTVSFPIHEKEAPSMSVTE